MALPADDTNLETVFTGQDYYDVATEDNVFVDLITTAEYAIFEFKDQSIDATLKASPYCVLKSSLATTESTAYLQIYNRTSGLWETITSNSTTAANTKFTLTGTFSGNPADYYDGSFWASCRVYQLIN